MIFYNFCFLCLICFALADSNVLKSLDDTEEPEETTTTANQLHDLPAPEMITLVKIEVRDNVRKIPARQRLNNTRSSYRDGIEHQDLRNRSREAFSSSGRTRTTDTDSRPSNYVKRLDMYSSGSSSNQPDIRLIRNSKSERKLDEDEDLSQDTEVPNVNVNDGQNANSRSRTKLLSTYTDHKSWKLRRLLEQRSLRNN